VKGSGPTPSRLASIKSSLIWPQFQLLCLDTPIRSAQDPQYTAFVDRIGEDYMQQQVPLHLLEETGSIEDAIDFLFPEDILTDAMSSLKRAFLTPKNLCVDSFNNDVLNRLPGEERPCIIFLHPFPHTHDSIKSFTTVQTW
jgi:hypothetical protein